MKIVENQTDKKLEGIEAKLVASGLLKVDTITQKDMATKKPIKGLAYIIANIGYNGFRKTLYVSNGRKQCDHFCRRSQGDLFRIMKYYYPDITLKEVRALLFELINTKHLRTSYCFSVKKRVFYKYGIRRQLERNGINDVNEKDEFKLKLKLEYDQ